MSEFHGQVVGEFEKISREAYEKLTNNDSRYIAYDNIKLPTRKTDGSAGYDIYMTENVYLRPGESHVVNTMLKCFVEGGWFMSVWPKSGLGFKYRMMLANTIGVIDLDYYNCVSEGPDNEGHIMIKIVNGGDYNIELEAGKAFVQGIFLPFGITKSDDKVQKVTRTGGIGSTNNT